MKERYWDVADIPVWLAISNHPTATEYHWAVGVSLFKNSWQTGVCREPSVAPKHCA